jgi:hypothetical protein
MVTYNAGFATRGPIATTMELVIRGERCKTPDEHAAWLVANRRSVI